MRAKKLRADHQADAGQQGNPVTETAPAQPVEQDDAKEKREEGDEVSHEKNIPNVRWLHQRLGAHQQYFEDRTEAFIRRSTGGPERVERAHIRHELLHVHHPESPRGKLVPRNAIVPEDEEANQQERGKKSHRRRRERPGSDAIHFCAAT